LGERLHIGLVTAYPNLVVRDNDMSLDTRSTFPVDELLAYDLEISYDVNDIKHKERRRLKDLGLLKGKNTIVYENHI
jgi:hypothetical protein